jgi:hypothetical protein
MGFYFFPIKNRINGKYVNVFGERYDIKKVDENEILSNRKQKRIFKSEKDYVKYCDLREFKEFKRSKKK